MKTRQGPAPIAFGVQAFTTSTTLPIKRFPVRDCSDPRRQREGLDDDGSCHRPQQFSAEGGEG